MADEYGRDDAPPGAADRAVELRDVTLGAFLYGGIVLSGLYSGALALLAKLTWTSFITGAAACFALSFAGGGAPVRYSIVDGDVVRKTVWRTRSMSIGDIQFIRIDWNPKGGNTILISDGREAFRLESIGEKSLPFRRELGKRLEAIDSPALRTIETRKLLGIEEST